MSGFVLHPGHDELHGITVVLTSASGRLYVGRWHERQERGVVMRDATICEPGTDQAEWLAGLRKFGVPPEHRTLVVPADDVVEVAKL